MHSVYSDGSGEIKEIAEAANHAGLDYIILTDHNTLRAKEEGYEGYYNNTLLIVGYEINDKENRNHYLALGVNKTFSTRLSAPEYVNKINESGGFGFIAHPHEKRNSMPQHPAYPWTAWECNTYTGIEIWNHMSEWMENLTEENKYQSFLHPLRTISGPAEETLKQWDKVNRSRRVVGIGGVDAHAHKINVLGFFEVEVFPYKVLFKSIRTHILTDYNLQISLLKADFSRDVEILLNALKKGSCFISNFYHGDARGFRFFAEVGGRTIGEMGDAPELTEGLKLRAKIPLDNFQVILLKDGEAVCEFKKSEIQYDVTEPGVYRIEVKRNSKAWIFSNPIRIGL